jgi:two-component system chemotaxis response regulator CheY
MTYGDKKHTVIVADDDMFMRTQAKIALQEIAEVIEADNGATALELYKKHKPTVLLLDIHMPKQGGKDVLKDVLAFDPNAYVIMFSADAVEKNVVETKFSGARGFIAKPFTKAHLIKYVTSCPAMNSRPDNSAKA